MHGIRGNQNPTILIITLYIEYSNDVHSLIRDIHTQRVRILRPYHTYICTCCPQQIWVKREGEKRRNKKRKDIRLFMTHEVVFWQVPVRGARVGRGSVSARWIHSLLYRHFCCIVLYVLNLWYMYRNSISISYCKVSHVLWDLRFSAVRPFCGVLPSQTAGQTTNHSPPWQRVFQQFQGFNFQGQAPGQFFLFIHFDTLIDAPQCHGLLTSPRLPHLIFTDDRHSMPQRWWLVWRIYQDGWSNHAAFRSYEFERRSINS